MMIFIMGDCTYYCRNTDTNAESAATDRGVLRKRYTAPFLRFLKVGAEDHF